MGLLGALGAVAIAASPLDREVAAVALADDVMGFELRRLGQVDRIGTHVGDETGGFAVDLDALIQALGHRHGALGAISKLAAGLLLEGAGGEGWCRVALAAAHLERADRGRRAAQLLGVGLGRGFVGDDDLVTADLGAAGHRPAVHLDQGGPKGLIPLAPQRGLQGPVLARLEGLDLALALDDEAHGHGLHPPGRETAADLAGDERAQRVTHDAVHDAACLLGIDEAHVDVAWSSEGGVDGGLGDLAEGHPAPLVIGDVHGLHDVPGDGLALAIEVRGEVDQVRGGRRAGDGVELLATVLVDDVLGREVMLDVHAQLALAGILGQVADMTVGGQHLVAFPQVSLDRPRLGGRLDDHQVLGHGRRV